MDNDRLILEAIEHWKRLRDGIAGEAPYSQQCPLCRVYLLIPDIKTRCADCPVQLFTNTSACDGTPYVTFYFLWQEHNKDNHEALVNLAQQEIDFLHKVLEHAQNNR